MHVSYAMRALRCAIQETCCPHLPDHLQRRAEQPIEIRGQRFVFRDGLLDGLLRRRPLIAQVGQRREHVIDSRALHGRLRRRHGKVVELVFELDHQPLGQAFCPRREYA